MKTHLVFFETNLVKFKSPPINTGHRSHGAREKHKIICSKKSNISSPTVMSRSRSPIYRFTIPRVDEL
jgi:hypothetical protein